ncbi:tRNA methyltransferas-like protein [Massariosphaeria phaeospora]|uniref:tRNA methyltransferas-like protein n=1 Tax=Massariosphaeria phaeospora TaxID=100035 RepID=A0A7C8IAP6_9PLEO|nr:tRNA methyltransferas-like protein [Massariosphaeria phaeospora]
MKLPYQCIEVADRSIDSGNEWLLFGASGSKLIVQSSTGVQSVWPAEEDEVRHINRDDEPEEPPGKRVKLSPAANPELNVSCVTLSSDKQYLVAVTAEDKCIRVFQINSEYQLHELSQRCMARRPCSIILTPDDSTILCADKFGDVYSLPLLPSPDDEEIETPQNEQTEPVVEKPYAPAASLLTVHSGRNRKTLEEQLKQASKGPSKPKEPLKFKHELLLGHVSMLTDILYATVDDRSYVLTADRDEHIRISRGLPQAHIIEGFCLGHEDFVSRLCLSQSGLLVSGGGDASLLVWDWFNNQLIERLPIRDSALSYFESNPQLTSILPEDRKNFKVAVRGIWDLASGETTKYEILVACEGIPALFQFTLGDRSKPGAVISLNGNALDVAFLGSSENTRKMIVVSVDNVHKPGSTTAVRDSPHRLQCFSRQGNGEWEENSGVAQSLDWFSRQAPDGNDNAYAESNSIASDTKDLAAVRAILYGLENLRKRPGAED